MFSLIKPKKSGDNPFKIPKSVQQFIPVDQVWQDGIFRSDNWFSKSWKLADINYAVASKEDQTELFLGYSELLNSLDAGATTQITINNRRLNRQDFEKTILIPAKPDGLNTYRNEYNAMLEEKAITANNNLVQEKIITISIVKKDINEARSYFNRISAELQHHLTGLSSSLSELNATERLRILHDFFRIGDETYASSAFS